jgi:hypothetical protein
MWELRIFDPLGTPKKTITDGVDPISGVVAMEGIESCKVAPSGDCLEMAFRGRNDRLGIDSRDIVQYVENGNELFWGPVLIHPHTDTPGAGPQDENPDWLERFVVAGGRKLLEDSVVGLKIFEEETDTATLLFLLAELYAHEAITVDAANFPITGRLPNLIARPYSQLADTFDVLSEAAGVRWGVNALGAVFIK